MIPEEEKQTLHSMVKSDFSDIKFDKTNELNETMSISPSPADELENKIKGGIY